MSNGTGTLKLDPEAIDSAIEAIETFGVKEMERRIQGLVGVVAALKAFKACGCRYEIQSDDLEDPDTRICYGPGQKA